LKRASSCLMEWVYRNYCGAWLPLSGLLGAVL
jgi:hypothetical protein